MLTAYSATLKLSETRFQNKKRSHPTNADFESNDVSRGLTELTQRTHDARFEGKEAHSVATDVVILIVWYFHLETHQEASIPQAAPEGTVLSH